MSGGGRCPHDQHRTRPVPAREAPLDRGAGPNRTFADIGGLGGTVNETVSLALRHGARKATMIASARAAAAFWLT